MSCAAEESSTVRSDARKAAVSVCASALSALTALSFRACVAVTRPTATHTEWRRSTKCSRRRRRRSRTESSTRHSSSTAPCTTGKTRRGVAGPAARARNGSLRQPRAARGARHGGRPYDRFLKKGQYDDAVELVTEGALTLLRAKQFPSGMDLALLIFQALAAGDAKHTEATRGTQQDAHGAKGAIGARVPTL